MVDIKVSGRKVTVTDALRSYVDEKIGDALKLFDIKPMSCDVVLRVDKNPSNPDNQVVEVTVFVRQGVHQDEHEAVSQEESKRRTQLWPHSSSCTVSGFSVFTSQQSST